MSKVDLVPRIKTFTKGTLINCNQPIMSFGGIDESLSTDDMEEVWIEKGSTIIFVEDKQFIEQKSIFIKAKIVTANGHIAWIDLFEESKSQWDFRTLRARKKTVAERLSHFFTEIGTKEK